MEIRTLPVPLNDEDLKVRADQLATKVKDKEHIEADKTVAASGFKEKIENVSKEIRQLATIVKERKEYRPVECHWVEHWKSWMMELVRNDTGERVDARPMTNEERQPKLFPALESQKGKPKRKDDDSANVSEKQGA